MSKFVVLLVVASLVAGICESKPRRNRRSADGDFDDDDSSLGGASDPFTSFFPASPKSDDFIDDIKNLAIPPNGHAVGHAKTESHETDTVNGKEVLDENKSDEVDNKDGAITEEKSDD